MSRIKNLATGFSFVLLIFINDTGFLHGSQGISERGKFVGEPTILEAISKYEQTKEYCQTLEEFRNDPEKYFHARIEALDYLIKCISGLEDSDRTLLEAAKGKREYLIALLPYADDSRCTKQRFFRKLDGLKMRDNYWYELIDPLHRVGPEVELRIELWQASDIPNYFIFLETTDDDPLLNGYAPFSHQVSYFGSDNRDNHRLRAEDGLVVLKGKPLDTGDGKKLFVLGLDNGIYVCDDSRYKFHHSSIVSGGSVRGAGELSVDSGRITLINNKSGHYHPSDAEVLSVLKEFKRQLGTLEGIQLQLKQWPEDGVLRKAVMADFDAEEFLITEGKCIAKDANFGWTPLHVAIFRNDIALVNQVMDPQMVNHKDDDGDTPLHLATKKGYIEWCRLLLDAGADSTIENDDGHSPLHLAAEKGDLDVITLLFSSENTSIYDNVPLVHFVAKSGNLEALRFFKDHGFDFKKLDKKGRSVFHYAAMSPNDEVVEWLSSSHIAHVGEHSDEEGVTPLHLAASKGRLATLRRLLPKADLLTTDRQGNTVLHYAVSSGDAKIVQYLLDHGCEELSWKANEKGVLPFHLAAKHSTPAVLELFIQRGNAIDQVDNYGNTAIHYAVNKKNNFAVRNLHLLVASGGNPFRENSAGYSPTHLAIRQGNLIQLMYLLSRTEDLFREDAEGNTLLHAAVQCEKKKTVEYLLNFFAVEDLYRRNDGGKSVVDLAESVDNPNIRSLIEGKLSRSLQVIRVR